jgi:uncharacterized protein YdeI (YjbR/CyaY-like superfamily)
MVKTNPAFGAYIKAAAPFAEPILSHLRKLVHKACPEVEETIKWGFPHFEYKGVMCSMAAFKNHCAFGFWKSAIMSDPEKIMEVKHRGAMGNFQRITSLSDLPSDKILIAYIKESKRLNEDDIKLLPRKKTIVKKLLVPVYFVKALKTNKDAWKNFDKFSYSNKKEYLEWIDEAKTQVTRGKRIETAVEWISEGKSRNWKYMKK